MHLSTVLAAAATGLSFVAAQGELTPPTYFAVQIEANQFTTNNSYVDYTLAPIYVSNTQSAAVFYSDASPAEFYQLVTPNTTDNTTFYSLLLDSSYGPASYLTPSQQEAYWNSLLFTENANSETRMEQNVFYINGTQDAMYLQMNPNSYVGFQGFIVCYWSQLLPELFFGSAFGPSPQQLPHSCSFVNLRIIPLEKTY